MLEYPTILLKVQVKVRRYLQIKEWSLKQKIMLSLKFNNHSLLLYIVTTSPTYKQSNWKKTQLQNQNSKLHSIASNQLKCNPES